MAVKVKDALPTVFALVHDEAIPAGGKAELLGDIARRPDDAADRLGVGLVNARDMSLRDDERVHRRDRTNVAKSNDVGVLEENLRGRRFRGDVAKNAARHGPVG